LIEFLLGIEEWLVDRKRIPADWRKKLSAVRARISSAFASLPKDIDPYFHTLDPEGRSGFLFSFFFFVDAFKSWVFPLLT